MDYISLEKEVEAHLLSKLSSKRASHCRSTAEYCRYLAGIFGVDEDKAYFAGLCHDIARETKKKEIIRLAHLYRPWDIMEDELEFPLLLHGRAGAGLLVETFDFKQEDILESITWHISGKVGMSDLTKVLFCADFLEPGRDFIDDDFRTKALAGNLDHTVKTVVISILNHRESRKHTPCQRERELFEALGLGDYI
ncbi:MAG: bis(5'-nucleosyl)-tetraphosphatase (symmetrical) YqeK [Spirochaetales bacterium]|nr:bis(5'-nucleosyl)-tetraphosphatase (symmetrical) YqeK [Spirochaetales bacterium]